MPSVGMVQMATKTSTAAWTKNAAGRSWKLPDNGHLNASQFAIGAADVPDHDRRDGQHDDEAMWHFGRNRRRRGTSS
jgi:hypothetical protein